MASSSIEWTELTWNPTTGCDKVSAGCKFCYAEVMSRRLQAMGVRGKELMKNPHSVSLEGWAAMWGMAYVKIETLDDFDALEAGDRMLIVEVVPSVKETEGFWAKWDALG